MHLPNVHLYRAGVRENETVGSSAVYVAIEVMVPVCSVCCHWSDGPRLQCMLPLKWWSQFAVCSDNVENTVNTMWTVRMLSLKCFFFGSKIIFETEVQSKHLCYVRKKGLYWALIYISTLFEATLESIYENKPLCLQVDTFFVFLAQIV